jgi:cell division transport system permease protein
VRTDFVFREVGTGLRRNVTMTVAMVLTTAISLLLVGTGLLAVRTIDSTESLYSDRLEVQVSLTQDVSAADPDCSQPICSGLKATLENSPLIASVRYESQQAAYKRFQQLFAGQSIAEVARPQSLPAQLRVKLADTGGAQADAGAAAVRRAMQNQVGVRTVIDQRDVVAKLFDFLGGVRNVTFALALVQAVAALLLISNTVQVSAYTRRTEVGVMRLVGATRWYTQLPFLIEAVVTGVVGAVLAGVGLVVGKLAFIDSLLAGIAQNGVIPPITLVDVVMTSVWLVPIGAAIAGVTGYVTLRLYVKV